MREFGSEVAILYFRGFNSATFFFVVVVVVVFVVASTGLWPSALAPPFLLSLLLLLLPVLDISASIFATVFVASVGLSPLAKFSRGTTL